MKNRIFFGSRALGIFTAIFALGLLLTYSVRFSFVYMDAALVSGAVFGFYVFCILACAFLFTVLCLKIRKNEIADKKPVHVLTVIAEVLGIVLVIFPVIVAMGDKTSLSSIFYLMKQAFPVWAAAVCGLFFAFVFPFIKNSAAKKIIVTVTAAAVAFTVYASLFPVTPYRFTAGPVVFDDGNGGYSVVFATNGKGTGYVDYELNGEQIRVYDEDSGRKNGQSIIHTVSLSKEALSGNTYKIGSVRLIDELSYGGRTGKTIESEEIAFNDSFGEDINVLSVSDWHTNNKKAVTAVGNIPYDYQAVVFLGDCAPGLMSENDVVKYIIDFGHSLTNGEMPVIYTRGNHETRGREAVNLSSELGIDSFYFETKLGNYNIIVLDSCEDKNDDHPEYGGMVNYKAYRTEMVKHLESLEMPAGNTLAFCHSDDICIEDDLSERALGKLEQLNVSLLVSGHLHRVIYHADEAVPYFVDGGINSNGKGTYAASMLRLTKDGINILCYDNLGNMLTDEMLGWKAQQK